MSPARNTEPEQRNQMRQQIAQDIYSAVEKAPMSFVADGGETAVLLAELAIKRLEEAGWQRPADQPREYGVAIKYRGSSEWQDPGPGAYGKRADALEEQSTIMEAPMFAKETRIVSRTKAGDWEPEEQP